MLIIIWSYIVYRKCNIWLFHWPWVESSCWLPWFKVFLWTEARLDWLGHYGLDYGLQSIWGDWNLACQSTFSYSLPDYLCGRCFVVWGQFSSKLKAIKQESLLLCWLKKIVYFLFSQTIEIDDVYLSQFLCLEVHAHIMTVLAVALDLALSKYWLQNFKWPWWLSCPRNVLSHLKRCGFVIIYRLLLFRTLNKIFCSQFIRIP